MKTRGVVVALFLAFLTLQTAPSQADQLDADFDNGELNGAGLPLVISGGTFMAAGGLWYGMSLLVVPGPNGEEIAMEGLLIMGGVGLVQAIAGGVLLGVGGDSPPKNEAERKKAYDIGWCSGTGIGMMALSSVFIAGGLVYLLVDSKNFLLSVLPVAFGLGGLIGGIVVYVDAQDEYDAFRATGTGGSGVHVPLLTLSF